MKTTLKSLLLVATAFALAWFGWAPLALAQSARVDTVSNKNFEATVKQVETTLKSKGMMVVAIIDHQNQMRMVGANVKGSKTIEFGNADMGKMLFAADPGAILEMPGKLYVYERADGKTVVSYHRPSAGFAAYGKEALTKIGQMMDMTVGEVVAEATK